MVSVVRAGARIGVIVGKGKGGYGHRYSLIVQPLKTNLCWIGLIVYDN